MKDKDGNVYDIGLISPETSGRRTVLVGVHANGAWLTPTQALRFAERIRRAAERAQKANT